LNSGAVAVPALDFSQPDAQGIRGGNGGILKAFCPSLQRTSRIVTQFHNISQAVCFRKLLTSAIWGSSLMVSLEMPDALT